MIRWLARATSALMLTTIACFAIGQGPPNLLRLNGAERAQFILFAGICAGLALGWRREKAGGALALVSLAGFYAVEYAVNGKLPRGWAFVALAVPGVLFLRAGKVAAERSSREGA